jgi:hypothetical protein
LLLLIQPLCQAETLATISKSSTACYAEQDAAARRSQESSTADAAALADSKKPDGKLHMDWIADKNVRITSNDITEKNECSCPIRYPHAPVTHFTLLSTLNTLIAPAERYRP